MNVALPPRVRAAIYLVVAVLGVLLSSTQAAFLSLGAQPPWLIAAWAAYGPIAAGFALTATSNTVIPPRADEKGPPPWQG